MPKSDEEQQSLQLSSIDVDLILRALVVYDRHVALLNSGVFPISEDDLADLNNDCEYLKGLSRHLQKYQRKGET